MGNFPVFGEGGRLEGDLSNSTGESSPSGTTFAAPVVGELPRVHDGREAQAAEEKWRLILQMQNPALLRAFDELECARAEHAAWQQRYREVDAAIRSKENRIAQRGDAGDHEKTLELRSELRTLTSQRSELFEETVAAMEELEVAQGEVDRLTKANQNGGK
jgi:hypothetical protein